MNGIEARYIGYDKTRQQYLVNVRTANPTGKIGDAGVIRFFETKNEAKDYTRRINQTKQDIFVPEKKEKNDLTVIHQGDAFVQSFKGNEDKNVKVQACPKISLWRGMFSKLTDEQIKAVNDTRKLPEGTKFQTVAGEHVICHNWFGLTAGTQVMPAGYELKKNIFGFTKVVPIGTEGKFIKNVK